MLMQRAEAGIPTDAPMIMRVALHLVSYTAEARQRRRAVLTYVAPDRRWVVDVTSPNDGVDELIQACKGGPDHVVAGAGVHGLDVPW